MINFKIYNFLFTIVQVWKVVGKTLFPINYHTQIKINTWLGQDWGQPSPVYIELSQLISRTVAELWEVLIQEDMFS